MSSHGFVVADKCCFNKADRRRGGGTRLSPKRPNLQLHDPEVIGFREAAVVEGVTGAAATQVQVLIHPQTKVTTASTDGKEVQVTLYEEGIFTSPSETLEARM